MSEEINDPETRKKAWYSDALFMFSRLSIWIAVPVILASLIGKYLDNKFSSEPWLLIACVGFSFVISMFGLLRETSRAFKKIEEEESKKMKK